MDLLAPTPAADDAAPLDPGLLAALACPTCKRPLRQDGAHLVCQNPACGARFAIQDGIPALLVDEAGAAMAGGRRVRGMRRAAQRNPDGRLARNLLAPEKDAFDPGAARKPGSMPARQAALYARASGRTVDVGIASGTMLAAYLTPREPARPPVTEIVGVEPLAMLLKQAVQRARALLGLPPFWAVLGWPERLPLPDGLADTVLFDSVLCGTPDPAAALRQAVQVLAPGGRVLLFEHVRPNGVWGALTDAADPLAAGFFCRLNNRLPALAHAAGLATTWEERWMGGGFWAAELRR